MQGRIKFLKNFSICTRLNSSNRVPGAYVRGLEELTDLKLVLHVEEDFGTIVKITYVWLFFFLFPYFHVRDEGLSKHEV